MPYARNADLPEAGTGPCDVPQGEGDESQSREARQPTTVVATTGGARDDGMLRMTPAQTERAVRESTAPRDDAPIVMPDGSTRTREQYDMAQAVGKDAADRQMRAAGRSTWNEDDYTVYARTMNDHLDRNLTLGTAAANRARTKTKARETASPAPRFSAPVPSVCEGAQPDAL